MSNTRLYGQNFLYSNMVGFAGVRVKACKVFGTVPGTWKIPWFSISHSSSHGKPGILPQPSR